MTKQKRGKVGRRRNTPRTARILRRKDKRRHQWEQNKYIYIDGVNKIRKPQWRNQT